MGESMEGGVKNPRFVELIRVSTSAQAERDTPALQRAALDRLAETRPGVRVELIEEMGISGAAELKDRPAFVKLRKLTDARAYDELRVYNIDRITRAESIKDRLAIYMLVEEAGAMIVETSGREIDPGDASGIGELDFMFRSRFARLERQRFRERSMAGRIEAARKGKACGARVPYALLFAEGAWKIAEDLGAIVRRIYTETVRGSTLSEIAKRLDSEGVPSPGGSSWRAATLQRIIRHPAYRGDLTVTFGEGAIRIEVPAIVDAGVWEAAQDSLAARRNRPRHEYGNLQALIRGLAYCHCGQPLIVESWTTNHRTHARRPVYCCRSSRKRYGPRCGKDYAHRADLVDEAVWSALAAQLQDPDLLREAAEADGGEAETWERQAASCERESKRLQEHEAKVLRLLKRDLLSEDAAAEQLRLISAQRSTLAKTAKVAEKALRQRDAVADALRTAEARVKAIRDGIRDADFATRREFVRTIVPELPGFGVTIGHGGRITIRGALSLGEGLVHDRPSLPKRDGCGDSLPLVVRAKYR